MAPLAEDPFYEREVEGLDLRELFDILLRGKWIILGVVLLMALPAAVYFALQPSMYSSDVTLLVDKQSSSLADILPGGGNAGGWWQNQNNLGNEILVIQQSMPLAQTVAERLMQSARVPGDDQPLTVLRPLDSGDSLRTLDVAFRLQTDYVTASILPDADAIRLVAVSTSPQEAAYIANLYAEEFVEVTRNANRASYSEARSFLEGQVSDTEAALVTADNRVKDFMFQEGAVALPEETSQLVMQIGQAEAQRDAASVRARAAQARIAGLRGELARLEPSLQRSFSSGLDAELQTALGVQQEVERQLETFYRATPSLRADPNPGPEISRLRGELDRARAEVQGLRRRLAAQSLESGTGPSEPGVGFNRAALLRSQIADANVELQQAQSEQSQLGARIREYEAELSAVPSQTIELAQLQRERVAAEQLYVALRANLQEAQVAEQSQIGHAQIIRPGYPAAVPYGPKRLRNMVLVVLLGLGLGCALAVAKVRLDHRVNRPDDVRSNGFTLLGTIPDTTELIEEDFGGEEIAVVGGREVDTHLVTLLNPMAAASESYRALRTSVQFSRADSVISTLLVTSSNPSEGKSTTSINLAVVFAQSGRRVLIVDADLRKPTIHKKLGLPREPGLVQSLFSDGSTSEAMFHEVADDLYVLPAGSIVPNPSELLGSKSMRDLLDDLRGQFDVVIIDAPPVLAATDAVLVSTQVDATLLVARSGSTKDFDLHSVSQTLNGVGANLIGVVLNGFDVSKAYGYKYKYDYQFNNKYAYGSEDMA